MGSVEHMPPIGQPSSKVHIYKNLDPLRLNYEVNSESSQQRVKDGFLVLIISALGASMATNYLNLLPEATRKSLNKIVFIVFIPSLMFASLAETVTFPDLIAW
ncbi:hypothetical protein CsSME_00006076 [Camellia sinensis var. sinensis]